MLMLVLFLFLLCLVCLRLRCLSCLLFGFSVCLFDYLLFEFAFINGRVGFVGFYVVLLCLFVCSVFIVLYVKLMLFGELLNVWCLFVFVFVCLDFVLLFVYVFGLFDCFCYCLWVVLTLLLLFRFTLLVAWTWVIVIHFKFVLDCGLLFGCCCSFSV